MEFKGKNYCLSYIIKVGKILDGQTWVMLQKEM